MRQQPTSTLITSYDSTTAVWALTISRSTFPTLLIHLARLFASDVHHFIQSFLFRSVYGGNSEPAQSRYTVLRSSLPIIPRTPPLSMHQSQTSQLASLQMAVRSLAPSCSCARRAGRVPITRPERFAEFVFAVPDLLVPCVALRRAADLTCALGAAAGVGAAP
jgi:hypothetical protein